MMEISARLRERFCKDCKIPVDIFHEPYFSERLKLTDSHFDSLSKWGIFVDGLSCYANEEEYFADYNRVKDSAIDSIKASDAYQRFNSEDMDKFAVKFKNLPSKDIFKPSFIGRRFLSIDMVKANFSSLSFYDKGIFGDADSWEDFIGRFTDNRHIINSKYIRQVVLGNCNPKRHITYEKYLMSGVLEKLLESSISLDKVVFFSNDEIVVDITGLDSVLEPIYLEQFETVTRGIGIPLRFESFTLRGISGTNGYMKASQEGVDFKCLAPWEYVFVLRRFAREEITDNDKVFYYNGLLCKFMEVPEIDFD